MYNGLSEFSRTLLTKVGITDFTGIFEPIIEDAPDGRVFIKFMSDGGVHDNKQGWYFRRFWEKTGCYFNEMSRRSFKVSRATLENVVGVKLNGEPPSRQVPLIFDVLEIKHIFRNPGSGPPRGEWVEEVKTIARREASEVDPHYHDMKVGEHRTITAGYEIVRIA